MWAEVSFGARSLFSRNGSRVSPVGFLAGNHVDGWVHTPMGKT